MNTSIYILYFYIASSRCKTNNRTTATNERTDRLPRSSFVALLILARMISCGVPSGLLTAPQLADHIIHCPSSSTALIEKTDADGPPLCCGEVCNEPTGSAVLYVCVWRVVCLPGTGTPHGPGSAAERERERERALSGPTSKQAYVSKPCATEQLQMHWHECMSHEAPRVQVPRPTPHHRTSRRCPPARPAPSQNKTIHLDSTS
jgi:hypothetical protein